MTGGHEAGGPRRGGRLGSLGRRYYPLGIAGAFLATVVGFFPSTLPLAVGGPFGFGALAAPQPAPSAGPGPGAPLLALPFVGGLEPPVASGSGADQGLGPQGSLELPPVDTTPTGSEPPPSPPACPLPVPTTGTPLDAVLAEVATLCAQLAGDGTASAPVPTAFVLVDDALAGDPVDRPAATVVLGLVEGAAVPGPMAAAVPALRQVGASTVLLLVARPDAPGGSSAFADWVTRTAGAMAGVDEMAIGVAPSRAPGTTGASGTGALSGATVAAQVLGGVTAAQDVARRGMPLGLWWEDGGATAADAPVWAALAAIGAGSFAPTRPPLGALAFVAGTVTVPPSASGAPTSGCAAAAAAAAAASAGASMLDAAARRLLPAGVSVLVDAVGPSLPELPLPAGCAPVPAAASVGWVGWRLGDGPARHG